MTHPLSKIDLLNEALDLTGNNSVAVLGDGSDEDRVGGTAYEAGMEYMLDNADWKQLTTVVTLNSTGIAPTDSQFDTAFAKPEDCIHIIWVRVNQSSGTGGQNVPIDYQILHDQIVVNLFGQAPNVPPPPGSTAPAITVKYVQDPGGDAGPKMLRTFMTALRMFVIAGIYRGLHEDPAEARNEEQAARALLAEARSRSDQEQPKRAVFNHRITAARRIRRPWPQTPSGWGGTGTPG